MKMRQSVASPHQRERNMQYLEKVITTASGKARERISPALWKLHDQVVSHWHCLKRAPRHCPGVTSAAAGCLRSVDPGRQVQHTVFKCPQRQGIRLHGLEWLTVVKLKLILLNVMPPNVFLDIVRRAGWARGARSGSAAVQRFTDASRQLSAKVTTLQCAIHKQKLWLGLHWIHLVFNPFIELTLGLGHGVPPGQETLTGLVTNAWEVGNCSFSTSPQDTRIHINMNTCKGTHSPTHTPTHTHTQGTYIDQPVERFLSFFPGLIIRVTNTSEV